MRAIAKREFQSYFHSFIGCLFIVAVLFITGIYTTVYNLLSGLPDLTYVLSGVCFIFIIAVPLLTMRVLAEERRQRTDQLILTAPVSVGNIVAGKFLALGGIFTIPILIISVYPLILNQFGKAALLESYVSLAAFYLYGLTCIAIGIFVSSLTESQVIAAVITFALLFLGYMMRGICNMISAGGNWLTKLLGAFDLLSHYENLASGIFDVKSLVYYLTLIFLFLFLTAQSIQKRRYSISVKKFKMGAYSSVMIAAMVAAAVLVNLFVGEIPARYTTFDATSNRLYSLSEETKALAEGLEEKISIYVLANEGSQDTTLQKTLEQYAALSDQIEVSYVDPVVNPKFHTQYTDASITRNSLIVESGKRSRVIDYSSVYETSFDYSTYSQIVTGYDGEGQITSAISYVISDDMPKMYLLEGHGEIVFESDFYAAIEKANIDYETINLLQHEAIPEDAECIVINAPASDFSEDDTNKVLDYLKAGGNALIITAWTRENMSNFHKILEYYGVSMAEGLVLEGDMDAYYQSPFYILPTVEYDSVTDSVSGSFIFAPYAQGLLLPEEPEEGLELTTLLSTSQESYTKSDLESLTEYTRQETDVSGPFVLGVKAVKTEGDSSSAALIYSSESLFTSSADAMVSGANRKLFSSSLEELAEAIPTGVAVPAKSYDTEYLTLTQSNVVLMGCTITLVIPLAILTGGFLVWLKRRKV
ncbi:MAG: Gldg family protein [Lachnospiraceae bacterium]|nr:Gldg family protein [Lachnospiraceae bacterium]